MTDITKRVNYFDRQFLRAADFQDEQSYDLDRRRRHNRLLHGPGVAEGLQVSGNINDTFVSVSSGTAYDALGREIVLAAAVQVPLSAITATTATPAFITIAYSEQPSDPSTDPGVAGNSTRITEQPALMASVAAPPDPGMMLLLAKVAVTNGKVSGTLDNSVRTQAGALLSPDATLRSVTLRNDSFPQSSWPKLECDGQNSAAVQNARLTLDASREVFFADGGQIRSFDDTHRIVFNRGSNPSVLEVREAGVISFMTGATPSERMRIGNGPSGNTTVSVGVPGAAQSTNVTINGKGAFLTVSDASGNNDVRLGSDSTGGMVGTLGSADLQFRTNNDPKLVVRGTNGNVGIGTTTPAVKLDVVGDIHATGEIKSPGGGSDLRLKKNIAVLPDALAKVESIRGVTFEWNEHYEAMSRASGRREIGVIAQEVEKACPELVAERNDGYKAVDYGRMTALLIEAVKELAAQNRALEKRVKELEIRLARSAPRDATAQSDAHPDQFNGAGHDGRS